MHAFFLMFDGDASSDSFTSYPPHHASFATTLAGGFVVARLSFSSHLNFFAICGILHIYYWRGGFYGHAGRHKDIRRDYYYYAAECGRHYLKRRHGPGRARCRSRFDGQPRNFSRTIRRITMVSMPLPHFGRRGRFADGIRRDAFKSPDGHDARATIALFPPIKFLNSYARYRCRDITDAASEASPSRWPLHAYIRYFTGAASFLLPGRLINRVASRWRAAPMITYMISLAIRRSLLSSRLLWRAIIIGHRAISVTASPVSA